MGVGKNRASMGGVSKHPKLASNKPGFWAQALRPYKLRTLNSWTQAKATFGRKPQRPYKLLTFQ